VVTDKSEVLHVQFGPFLVRPLSTSVLRTDLDIHFGPLSVRSL